MRCNNNGYNFRGLGPSEEQTPAHIARLAKRFSSRALANATQVSRSAGRE